MTYDAIIKGIDRQLQRDSEIKDKEKFFLFREVKDHRTIQLSRSNYELLVSWENGNATRDPVSVMTRN